MKIIIGIFIIVISGSIGFLLENKMGIKAPPFYWVMGFITGLIILGLTRTIGE